MFYIGLYIEQTDTIMPMLNEENCFIKGKHTGKLISEVISTDIQYCLWLKDQDWVKKDQQLYDLVKDLVAPPMKMPFGKHKGALLSYLWTHENDYFNWVRNQACVQNNPKLKAEFSKYA